MFAGTFYLSHYLKAFLKSFVDLDNISIPLINGSLTFENIQLLPIHTAHISVNDGFARQLTIGLNSLRCLRIELSDATLNIAGVDQSPSSSMELSSNSVSNTGSSFMSYAILIHNLTVVYNNKLSILVQNLSYMYPAHDADLESVSINSNQLPILKIQRLVYRNQNDLSIYELDINVDNAWLAKSEFLKFKNPPNTKLRNKLKFLESIPDIFVEGVRVTYLNRLIFQIQTICHIKDTSTLKIQVVDGSIVKSIDSDCIISVKYEIVMNSIRFVIDGKLAVSSSSDTRFQHVIMVEEVVLEFRRSGQTFITIQGLNLMSCSRQDSSKIMVLSTNYSTISFSNNGVSGRSCKLTDPLLTLQMQGNAINSAQLFAFYGLELIIDQSANKFACALSIDELKGQSTYHNMQSDNLVQVNKSDKLLILDIIMKARTYFLNLSTNHINCALSFEQALNFFQYITDIAACYEHLMVVMKSTKYQESTEKLLLDVKIDASELDIILSNNSTVRLLLPAISVKRCLAISPIVICINEFCVFRVDLKRGLSRVLGPAYCVINITDNKFIEILLSEIKMDIDTKYLSTIKLNKQLSNLKRNTCTNNKSQFVIRTFSCPAVHVMNGLDELIIADNIDFNINYLKITKIQSNAFQFEITNVITEFQQDKWIIRTDHCIFRDLSVPRNSIILTDIYAEPKCTFTLEIVQDKFTVMVHGQYSSANNDLTTTFDIAGLNCFVNKHIRLTVNAYAIAFMPDIYSMNDYQSKNLPFELAPMLVSSNRMSISVSIKLLNDIFSTCYFNGFKVCSKRPIDIFTLNVSCLCVYYTAIENTTIGLLANIDQLMVFDFENRHFCDLLDDNPIYLDARYNGYIDIRMNNNVGLKFQDKIVSTILKFLLSDMPLDHISSVTYNLCERSVICGLEPRTCVSQLKASELNHDNLITDGETVLLYPLGTKFLLKNILFKEIILKLFDTQSRLFENRICLPGALVCLPAITHKISVDNVMICVDNDFEFLSTKYFALKLIKTEYFQRILLVQPCAFIMSTYTTPMYIQQDDNDIVLLHHNKLQMMFCEKRLSVPSNTYGIARQILYESPSCTQVVSSNISLKNLVTLCNIDNLPEHDYTVPIQINTFTCNGIEIPLIYVHPRLTIRNLSANKIVLYKSDSKFIVNRSGFCDVHWNEGISSLSIDDCKLIVPEYKCFYRLSNQCLCIRISQQQPLILICSRITIMNDGLQLLPILVSLNDSIYKLKPDDFTTVNDNCGKCLIRIEDIIELNLYLDKYLQYSELTNEFNLAVIGQNSITFKLNSLLLSLNKFLKLPSDCDIQTRLINSLNCDLILKFNLATKTESTLVVTLHPCDQMLISKDIYFQIALKVGDTLQWSDELINLISTTSARTLHVSAVDNICIKPDFLLGNWIIYCKVLDQKRQFCLIDISKLTIQCDDHLKLKLRVSNIKLQMQSFKEIQINFNGPYFLQISHILEIFGPSLMLTYIPHTITVDMQNSESTTFKIKASVNTSSTSINKSKLVPDVRILPCSIMLSFSCPNAPALNIDSARVNIPDISLNSEFTIRQLILKPDVILMLSKLLGSVNGLGNISGAMTNLKNENHYITTNVILSILHIAKTLSHSASTVLNPDGDDILLSTIKAIGGLIREPREHFNDSQPFSGLLVGSSKAIANLFLIPFGSLLTSIEDFKISK